MTGADNSTDVLNGAPGLGGHDDVSAVLGVNVEPEAGGLVVVQEEGGAVLTGTTSETKKFRIPCFHKKRIFVNFLFISRQLMIQRYTRYYTWEVLATVWSVRGDKCWCTLHSVIHNVRLCYTATITRLTNT